MHWTPIDGTTLLHLAIDFDDEDISGDTNDNLKIGQELAKHVWRSFVNVVGPTGFEPVTKRL
jgi:hypothetical protein